MSPVRRELVSVAAQPAPQVAEVVDLTVQDHGHRAILVVNRLVARDEVDDAQALNAQPDTVIDMQTSVIGPAVGLCSAHALERLTLHGGAIGPCYPGDSAHRPGLSARRLTRI